MLLRRSVSGRVGCKSLHWCTTSCSQLHRFLQARLMVEAITHCTSLKSVRNCLEELPPTLELLYEAAFQRIREQASDWPSLAKRVLTWVAYAFMPLTLEELQYAVADDPSTDWADPKSLVDQSVLISACCGLLNVETEVTEDARTSPKRSVVRFVRQCPSSALF